MSEILLIDDDPELLKYIEVLLESDGHNVVLAKDSDEAREQFLASRFDLVITDIFLQGEDTLDAIQRYKAGRRQPKVIAMSGGGRHQNFGYLGEAKTRGADETIEKPIEDGVFLGVVRQCLSVSLE